MILEMRTYVLKPGMTQNFVERFAEGLTARLQFSKLLGLWQSEVGGLNRVVHVWPYDSFEERERIAGEARKTGKWPPKTQEFMITRKTRSSSRRLFHRRCPSASSASFTSSALILINPAPCRRCWNAGAR